MNPAIGAALINGVVIVFVAIFANKKIQEYQHEKIMQQKKWEIQYYIFSEISRVVVNAMDKAEALHKYFQRKHYVTDPPIDGKLFEFRKARDEIEIMRIKSAVVFDNDDILQEMSSITKSLNADKIKSMKVGPDYTKFVNQTSESMKKILILMYKDIE